MAGDDISAMKLVQKRWNTCFKIDGKSLSIEAISEAANPCLQESAVKMILSLNARSPKSLKDNRKTMPNRCSKHEAPMMQTTLKRT